MGNTQKCRACVACPFRDGENEEATIAQNLGCLPSKFDMIEKLDREQVALSCHENDKVPCRGLAEVRNVSKAEVKAYSDWYQNG